MLILRSFVSWCVALCALCPGVRAGDPPGAPAKALIDLGKSIEDNRIAPSSEQVSVSRSEDAAGPGILLTIEPGKESYPGIKITPQAPWDLSGFGHVEARVVNTGAKAINLSLRVDNAGDWKKSPWNTESIAIKPGQAGTVRVIFGYQYGFKPGYALKPDAVVRLMLFAARSNERQSFRIESIQAAGPAGEKPPEPKVDSKSMRVKPRDGILLGAGVGIDPAKQLTSKNAEGALAGNTIRATFASGKSDQSVSFKPAVGRWDLRDYLEVRARVRNDGAAPLTPRLRLESNKGPTDWASTAEPLAAGEVKEIVVSFIPAVPWQGIPNSGDKTNWEGQKGTGSSFLSDAVSGVTISAKGTGKGQVLAVESIQAAVPTPPPLPQWLGKRPPVEGDGDWVQTFAEEFEGSVIDEKKWNIYGENYWDKQSHFSKDNTIIGGGVVKLHFQKKHGHQNDDANHKRVTDYATGFLDTYGKWVQRYGYFEARMKLPTAPGLWPAFWLMPDRGVEVGPQWKRQDTGKGAMEFDVFEHLTRWGPYRTNIAWHWDGYQKEHKQTGSEKIYFQPDRDGFVTAGLLWTPSLAVYYCNGREVARWECERISNVQSNMMFTLPMGGWDNSPLDDSKLPDDFVIDYVRCWQRKDLASNVDGLKRPATAPAQ